MQDPLTELYLLYLGGLRWAAYDVEAPGHSVENADFGARHTWFNSQQLFLPAMWPKATEGNSSGIQFPISRMGK